ncbi:MAG: hypothetical protein QY310_00445 [Candidatus Jettenia sp. CY-1]|nr:MAG: hypothetical protein QY310_00445 [Candidatus Jettenia sp. CY-1]
MFLESSRYNKIKTVDVIMKDGRAVKAITLRKLPFIQGKHTMIKGNDRLDIIARRTYNNPTMFWRIADANTELQVNDLVKETGRMIKIPER